MITPKEIEEKEFNKVFRGYDVDEVDEFLDLIILDMQGISSEIARLQNENDELRAENEEHKKSERRVMTTLESAKKLMKDISESAEKRADIIIRNAKMDAETILNEARNTAGVAPVTSGEELRDRVAYFRSRYRQLLMDELENMDSKGGDLLTALEQEFMPASMEELGLEGFSDDLSDGLEVGATMPISEEEMEKALQAAKSDFASAVKIEDEAYEEEALQEEFFQMRDANIPQPKDTIKLDGDAIDELVEKNTVHRKFTPDDID